MENTWATETGILILSGTPKHAKLYVYSPIGLTNF